jgi:hypothetical protein
MNDATLKQIAAVKAMVNKGSPILDIEPHRAILLRGRLSYLSAADFGASNSV